MNPDSPPSRILLIILTLSILLAASIPTTAAQYQIKQITNTPNIANQQPQINNHGHLVWQGVDLPMPSTKSSIYFYNGNEINRLTTSENNNASPFINNNSQIVWGSGEGVCIYNNGITTKLFEGMSPKINDKGQVVYMLGESGGFNIIHYDITTGTKTHITNTTNIYNEKPHINNRSQIVWKRTDGSYCGNIMLYSNGETINLTNNSQSTVDHSHQQTNDNGQIVWSASTKQLFLYDKNISNTPINIWSSSYNYSIIPQVSNYGIVWSGYNGHSFDIYLYDFGNRGITKVAENANTTDNHGINDYGQIVWTASGNIYHWANGATTQITNSNGNGSPRINNLGQIVFTKGYYGVHNTDICFATPQPDKFVFPVLGISQTDPYKNYNDPLQDGWAGKGVGQVSATDGHLGQDYYLKIGDCAGKPVYAIYPGEVVEVMNGSGRFGWCDDSDHGWGPVLVLKHTSGNGFKVSENAIVPLGDCGTDRNPKVIYSLYGHLSKDSIKDISVGQAFEAGDQIGTIGKYGVDQASWTTNHLHFEIKDEVGFSEGSWYSSHSGQCPGTAAQSCGAQGIGTGYSHSPGFAPHRYIPSVFIVENQGRKAQVQGALNLLMTD